MKVFTNRFIGLSAAFLAALPQTSYAHSGHLGELAGHSHEIALGVVTVAGVVAAVLAGLSSRNEDKIEVDQEAALDDIDCEIDDDGEPVAA